MSRIKAINSITLIAVMFFSGLVVCAQQTPPDNATRIRELRSEIEKREEPNIPEDLKDLNLSILIERRAQLRTALKTEIEALKRRRAELGAFITREEERQIVSKVQDYEAEVVKLGRSIQRDLAATTYAGSGNPVNNPPSDSAVRQAESLVNSGGSALPQASPSPQATPSPNAAGRPRDCSRRACSRPPLPVRRACWRAEACYAVTP